MPDASPHHPPPSIIPPLTVFFLRRRSDFVTLATETQKEEDSVALNKNQRKSWRS